MRMASPLVRVFFEQYEHTGETLDLDVIGTEYAASFMFAGPSGARVIEKQKLLAALAQRRALQSVTNSLGSSPWMKPSWAITTYYIGSGAIPDALCLIGTDG
jgi:hypothetical protein